MNNYIFYFSGTGNSLYTAKWISSKIENTGVISIAKHIHTGYDIENADTVGFVLPVYVFGAPIMAEEFLTKLTIKAYTYLYVVFVHGGAPYSAVFDFTQKLTQAGFRVDAGYEVVSADNYIEGTNPPDSEQSHEILSKTQEELEKVIKDIQDQKKTFPKTVFWKKFFGSLMQPSFKKTASKASQKFRVTTACTGCATCVKLCPKEIISLNTENRPEWKGTNCEMCFACIHLCPTQAIDIGKKTQGRNRYKNPEITLRELMLR